MNPEITIRRAESVADYKACQDAQRLAWGITDESYIVPVATMVGAQHHGGLVLGAFLPDGSAAGVSFAFLGRTEGRLCLYSQLTGIIPGYQDHGIGYCLKTKQREIARAEQISCIAWAFDPLQAGNARFNLGKLGATAGRFIENMYGFRTDALNLNTPTDRLIVEWETSPNPRSPVEASEELPHVIRLVGQELPTFTGLPKSPSIPFLLEIPSDITNLRTKSTSLSAAWGTAVRQAFLASFAAGYRAVGFFRDDSQGERRAFYILASRSLDDANGSTIQPE